MSDDQLDELLREWHEQNRARAVQGRDRLISALQANGPDHVGSRVVAEPQATDAAQIFEGRRRFSIAQAVPWRIAAAIALLSGLAVILLPQNARPALADTLLLPQGGRLDAFDQDGNVVGPCALTHTDVAVDISGLFVRTTVRQQYHNPYDAKIEALYTFPLSHNAAVDRMRMVIDEDRIVEGEVREREEARQMYESAREAGHVAALLEQQRPNIFTQQVANIEPGAKIDIEISYIELVEQRDGEFRFAFPMTVAPRYIPGYALGGADVRSARGRLPEGLQFRRGIILQGPASFERMVLMAPEGFDASDSAALFKLLATSAGPAPYLDEIIDRAVPISGAGLLEWRARPENHARYERLPDVSFAAIYSDGSRELGQLSGDGVGHISGRWFWFEPGALQDLGFLDAPETHPLLAPPSREGDLGPEPFAPDTDQVPDASRITPMPVHPSTRAGHDVSVRVTIDTGGPAITSIESELHEIQIERAEEPGPLPEAGSGPASHELGSRVALELKNEAEIPNRDFVLKWKLDDAAIQESTFVHAGDDFEQNGGYFTLILAPPARVDQGSVRPRELIFVLDTSGSMSGQPIAKAKSVLTSTIDAMREGDTFNVITFAGHTDILWDEPRPNTDENRAEALTWINAREGQGGTEMMMAIEAALNPDRGVRASRPQQEIGLMDLSNLPADGREATVLFPRRAIEPGDAWSKTAWGALRVRDDLAIDWTAPSWSMVPLMDDGSIDELIARGTWSTRDGRRYFDMHEVLAHSQRPTANIAGPMRLCIFLTDGEVGNDMAIIDAVKKYAATTRVFAFGVGNSVNRYLLANMAHAGRGEVEFVTQESERRDAVERFVRRIESPVLTDIELDFSEGLEVSDILPLTPGGYIPDLYDVQPLIIHGRYTQAGNGTLTVRGRTGGEAYERALALDLPERAEGHDVIRTLWARKKVDELTNADLTGVQLGQVAPEQRQAIVDLAVKHQIMSQFTSFVAIEKSRVTVNGRPVLVRVPIELPSDARWEGFFGSDGCIDRRAISRAVKEMLHQRNAAIQLRSEQLEALRTQYAGLSEEERQAEIHRLLLGVRDLQMERRYGEAHQLVDQILFIDEGNPVALALRDAILTAEQWQEYMKTNRSREFSYTWQNEDNRRASIAPRPNFGPGARSTTGLMQYPKDWPALQIQRGQSLHQARAVDPLFHLGDYFTSNGRLKDPLIFDSFSQTNGLSKQIAFGQQFGIPTDTPPTDVTYITSPAGPPIQTTEGWAPVNFQQDSFNLVDLLGGFGSDSFAATILSNNPALMSTEADQRVAVALQSTLPTVEFQDNRLEQVLEFLQTVSNINIQADWPALATIGVEPDVRIKLAMKEVSVAAVLDQVLAQVWSGEEAVGWRITDGLVVIGPESVLDKVECIYDLRDLIGSLVRKDAPEAASDADLERLREAKAQELVQLIQTNIDPDGWQDGDIEVASGILTVRTSVGNHINVAGLLSQLWEIYAPLDLSNAPPVSQSQPTGHERLAQAVSDLTAFVASSELTNMDHASPRAAAALALVFDPNDPAHQPFYVERCAIEAAGLARAGHGEEARTLAAWIIAVLDPTGHGPGDPCHRELVAALWAFAGDDAVSKNLNPEAVDEDPGAAIEEAAEQSMADQLERAIIEDTLRTRLDGDLFTIWSSARAGAVNAPRETASDGAALPQEARSAEPVLVTILLGDQPSRVIQDALEGAGLEIVSVAAKMRLIVGRTGIDDLERVAMLPVVRRVERTE